MIRKIAYVTAMLSVALFVLFTSVFKSAAVTYNFNEEVMYKENTDEDVLGDSDIDVEYQFAYPGKILPDNPLWPVKAARDKAWLTLTTNDSREAELKLLLADKRAASARHLVRDGKFDLGYSTLVKAEAYLKEACKKETENRNSGIDTSVFLERLSRASLKHIETIKDVSAHAPEDAMPQLKKLEKIPQDTYEKSMHALNEKGMEVPENPFGK